MSRPFSASDFDAVYDQFICSEKYEFGGPAYYQRYRSRFKECMRRFAAIAPGHPLDILDVGGGQMALISTKLWGDRGVVSDLPGPHLSYIAAQGIETIEWNLCKFEPPVVSNFDFVFFLEVIEHLPIPGYIVLERLRKVLRPGGTILCTTPNLYRLRNLVYMAIGHPVFEHFQYPDEETALGHVLEYSKEHLDWQFARAGFKECRIDCSQMHHLPTNPALRPFALLGYPLHLVPHWRDTLIATAQAPTGVSADTDGGRA